MKRSTPSHLICCASLVACSATAQSFNVGPNGAQTGDDSFRVLAPEPVRVGAELAMAELPVALHPISFCLNVGTSGRYGPFDLKDGTVVGSKQAAYTLRMFDYGRHFTLHPAGDTNASYGPFSAADGAAVTLRNAAMTVVRVPPALVVSVAHPSRIAQAPLIGIAPLSLPVIRQLYDLRDKYVALANRVDTDTASAELQGVPRIRNNITGNSFSPVIKTSQRDKQNATKGAELSAMTFLESLFGQSFRIRSQSIVDGLTFRFRLPEAGDYVLCAAQKIKDPNAAPAGTRTVLWWTAFHFDGEHPLSLALTGENAITWREIFLLSHAR
jgi:hypothetical protein